MKQKQFLIRNSGISLRLWIFHLFHLIITPFVSGNESLVEIEQITTAIADEISDGEYFTLSERFDIRRFGENSFAPANVGTTRELPPLNVQKDLLATLKNSVNEGVFFQGIFPLGYSNFLGAEMIDGVPHSLLRTIHDGRMSLFLLKWTKTTLNEWKFIDIKDVINTSWFSANFSDSYAIDLVANIEKGSESASDWMVMLTTAIRATSDGDDEGFLRAYEKLTELGKPPANITNIYHSTLAAKHPEKFQELQTAKDWEASTGVSPYLKFVFYMGMKDFDGAINSLKELRETCFNDPYINYLEMQVDLSRSDFEAAVSCGEALTKELPEFFSNHFGMLMLSAYCGASQYDEAISFLKTEKHREFNEVFVRYIQNSEIQYLKDFRSFIASELGKQWSLSNGISQARLLEISRDPEIMRNSGNQLDEVGALTLSFIDSSNVFDIAKFEERFDLDEFQRRFEGASKTMAVNLLGESYQEVAVEIDSFIKSIRSEFTLNILNGTFFGGVFLPGKYTVCGSGIQDGKTVSTLRRLDGDEFNFVIFIWAESSSGELKIIDIVDLLHERDLSEILADNVAAIIRSLEAKPEEKGKELLNLEAMNAYRAQDFERFLELYQQCSKGGDPPKILNNAFLTVIASLGADETPPEIAELITERLLSDAPKLLRYEFQRVAGDFEGSLSTIGELEKITFFDAYISLLKLGVLNDAGRFNEAVQECEVIVEMMGGYFTEDLALKLSKAFCGASEYEKFVDVLEDYRDQGFPEMFVITVMENDPKLLSDFRGFLKSKPGFLWMIENGVEENALLQQISAIPTE